MNFKNTLACAYLFIAGCVYPEYQYEIKQTDYQYYAFCKKDTADQVEDKNRRIRQALADGYTIVSCDDTNIPGCSSTSPGFLNRTEPCAGAEDVVKCELTVAYYGMCMHSQYQYPDGFGWCTVEDMYTDVNRTYVDSECRTGYVMLENIQIKEV